MLEYFLLAFDLFDLLLELSFLEHQLSLFVKCLLAARPLVQLVVQCPLLRLYVALLLDEGGHLSLPMGLTRQPELFLANAFEILDLLLFLEVLLVLR